MMPYDAHGIKIQVLTVTLAYISHKQKNKNSVIEQTGQQLK